MTPMSEIENTLNLHPSRLPSAEQLASIGRILLDEVHRLRDIPPEVAAAMERRRQHEQYLADKLDETPYRHRHGGYTAEMSIDGDTIATHFTTLFAKGSQP